MSDDRHGDYRELSTFLCDVAYEMYRDDRLEGFARRLPSRPELVLEVEVLPHPVNSERARGVQVSGSFSTKAMMGLDHTGGRYDDRYDEIELYLTPETRPEHLGARVTISGQPGQMVSVFEMRPETVRDPDHAEAVSQEPSPAVQVVAADPAEPAADDAHFAALGSSEVVPPFDLSPFLDERTTAQLAEFRSFDAIEAISTIEPAAQDRLSFGLAPDFVPVIRLGTNGMVVGVMVDAPELGFADAAGCLFQYQGAGLALSDARVLVLSVIWRSLTDKRTALEARGDQSALERWSDLASDFAGRMGYTNFAKSGIAGFAWSDRRRKPERSPRRTKWRTDASGNGVLAAAEAWGEQPIRRPPSAAAALERASSAVAPALRLHLLREGLAYVNQTGDAALGTQVYAAMVDPLRNLGRDRAAARSAALAAAGPG